METGKACMKREQHQTSSAFEVCTSRKRSFRGLTGDIVVGVEVRNHGSYYLLQPNITMAHFDICATDWIT